MTIYDNVPVGNGLPKIFGNVFSTNKAEERDKKFLQNVFNLCMVEPAISAGSALDNYVPVPF